MGPSHAGGTCRLPACLPASESSLPITPGTLLTVPLPPAHRHLLDPPPRPRPSPRPPPPRPQACSDASFIIPLGLAAPYAWRLVQCIRVYLDTGARPQLFNALKYSTAFPVRLGRGVVMPVWLWCMCGVCMCVSVCGRV